MFTTIAFSQNNKQKKNEKKIAKLIIHTIIILITGLDFLTTNSDN